MARKSKTEKPGPQKDAPPKRLERGFLQTGSLLTKRIRGASEKRGFSEIRLLTHWSEIAGAAVSQIARPVKVSYGREGVGATLTLEVSGARAPEVQMMLPELRDKVNACYGYSAISRIRIVQVQALGFAEDTAPFAHKAERPLPPETETALKASLSPIADDGLKSALERLGRNILKRHALKS